MQLDYPMTNIAREQIRPDILPEAPAGPEGGCAMTKMISWNVNGLRACLGKGFLDFFREEGPDIMALQETKLQPGQVELELPGYRQ